MFGYVNINKNDLSREDFETYRSYYCGLCHVLRDYAGAKGQLLLNYDMTFLIILLTGLYEPKDRARNFRCPLHPARRRTMRVNEMTSYAADMNVLLSYYSFADDAQDEHSMSKRMLMKLFSKDYRRIFMTYPRQAAAVEKYIRHLSDAEKVYETNVDKVAGLTGDMLAEIFSYRNEMWSEDLRTLGFYLGKFIYIMDAYDDIDERYNVLAQTKSDNPGEFDTIVKLMLISMMSECAKAFERLPIIEHADILRNILYSGVWNKFEYIQFRKAKHKKTEEKRS